MAAPAPNLAPALAPVPVAPAPGVAAQPTNPPTNFSEVFWAILDIFWAAAAFIGTYFCVCELSEPWQNSHIPVVITLVPLCVLNLAHLLEWTECLIPYMPSKVTTKWTSITQGTGYQTFSRWRERLFGASLTACFFLSTYFAVRELSEPWETYHIGIIIALVPLAIVDLLMVIVMQYGIRAVISRIGERLRPTQPALTNWIGATMAPRPRVTRAQAQAELDKDAGNVV